MISYDELVEALHDWRARQGISDAPPPAPAPASASGKTAAPGSGRTQAASAGSGSGGTPRATQAATPSAGSGPRTSPPPAPARETIVEPMPVDDAQEEDALLDALEAQPAEQPEPAHELDLAESTEIGAIPSERDTIALDSPAKAARATPPRKPNRHDDW